MILLVMPRGRIAEGIFYLWSIFGVLAKIFTTGYVDFSKCSNEAGRNMMAHIESSSYIKNNDGSEIMNFVMNNPEGERADSSKVIIEISLSTTTTMGTRQGHTAIIFPQSDF